MVDAALGRTPKEAEAGRLSTYVGGDPDGHRVRPILETMPTRSWSAAGSAPGPTCKLVNNSITIGTVALFAESLRHRRKARRRSQRPRGVISAGGANGRMWQMIEPWICSGDDSL